VAPVWRGTRFRRWHGECLMIQVGKIEKAIPGSDQSKPANDAEKLGLIRTVELEGADPVEASWSCVL
jgi:hypothetical protein